MERDRAGRGERANCVWMGWGRVGDTHVLPLKLQDQSSERLPSYLPYAKGRVRNPHISRLRQCSPIPDALL